MNVGRRGSKRTLGEGRGGSIGGGVEKQDDSTLLPWQEH